MKFEDFNIYLNQFLEKESYKEVDLILENEIEEIIKLDSNCEIEKYLKLYASLAGDADSLDRFYRLFEKIVDLGKVKKISFDKL